MERELSTFSQRLPNGVTVELVTIQLEDGTIIVRTREEIEKAKPGRVSEPKRT